VRRASAPQQVCGGDSVDSSCANQPENEPQLERPELRGVRIPAAEGDLDMGSESQSGGTSAGSAAPTAGSGSRRRANENESQTSGTGRTHESVWSGAASVWPHADSREAPPTAREPDARRRAGGGAPIQEEEWLPWGSYPRVRPTRIL
jgi:hypothetical protein